MSLAYVILKMALAKAVLWNLVTRNVCLAVTPPRDERKEAAYVTAEQLQALFAEAERSGSYAPLMVAVGLGLRRAELLALQWRDVSFKRGTVTVNRGLQRIGGKLVATEPKTQKSRRTLVAPAEVVEALRAHRRSQLEQRMMLGLGAPPEDGWVFANSSGGPLDPDAYAHRFRRIAPRADLPDVHLHSLRHGNAVIGLQAGDDLKTVQARLGHASIPRTADT